MFWSKKSSVERKSREPGAFGDYQLRELINCGGMAEVWLATDNDHHSYALRRLHDDLQDDSTARKRFVQGCEILARVHEHENIVGYHEHGKIEGANFLAMEFVEGANLKLMLHDQDPVLHENVSQILIDTVSALEHVHECGFMHLDFKPENVLVTRNAAVRLADFDLSQPIPKSPKKYDKNPGTPGYMAPEQLSGGAIDQRVDIWAFGVSAYELLAQQKPFPGESAAEILNLQKNRSNFLTPRQINPSIPEGMERIILKCINLHPDTRPFTMREVADEVRASLYA